MTNLTLSFTTADGEPYVLTLTGRRAKIALWTAHRLPMAAPWAATLLGYLARAMGASVVPSAPYTAQEETLAYYQGFEDGFHDRPMQILTTSSDAYTRGYWEGKR